MKKLLIKILQCFEKNPYFCHKDYSTINDDKREDG